MDYDNASMDYDNASDTGSTDAEPMAEAGSRDDTFFIPPDLIPGAEKFKAGDKLSFTLIRRDKDGHLEVEFLDEAASENPDAWKDEMRSSMAAASAPPAAMMEEGT